MLVLILDNDRVTMGSHARNGQQSILVTAGVNASCSLTILSLTMCLIHQWTPLFPGVQRNFSVED